MLRDADKDLSMCEAAKDGPWFVRSKNGEFVLIAPGVVVGAEQSDIHFITESRSALPHWIKRAEKAEKSIESHGPEGRNYTNHEHITMRDRAAKAEEENKRLREVLKWIEYDAPPRWAEKASEVLQVCCTVE